MTQQTTPHCEWTEDIEEKVAKELNNVVEFKNTETDSLATFNETITIFPRLVDLQVIGIDQADNPDDIELMLLIDWDLIPNMDSGPMDITDIGFGIPEIVTGIQETVERETGYKKPYTHFELIGNLPEYAIYRAFVSSNTPDTDE